MIFRRAIVWAVVCVVSIAPGALHAQQPTSEIEEEIAEAVRQFAAAYGANDVEKYFSFYAKDISIVRVTGRFDRENYYQLWKTAVAEGGGTDGTKLEDLQIQVLPGGETAVATFDVPTVRKYRTAEAARGRDPNVIYHFTAVWARRSGNWSIVHAHWSVHQEPPPDSPFTRERNAAAYRSSR